MEKIRQIGEQTQRILDRITTIQIDREKFIYVNTRRWADTEKKDRKPDRKIVRKSQICFVEKIR